MDVWLSPSDSRKTGRSPISYAAVRMLVSVAAAACYGCECATVDGPPVNEQPYRKQHAERLRDTGEDASATRPALPGTNEKAEHTPNQDLEVLNNDHWCWPGTRYVKRASARGSGTTGRGAFRPCQPSRKRMAKSAGEAKWPVSCDTASVARDAMTQQHSRSSGVAGRQMESAAHTIAAQVLGAITLR